MRPVTRELAERIEGIQQLDGAGETTVVCPCHGSTFRL